MNISPNVSALQTNQTNMNKSAQNVANINNGAQNPQTDLAKEMTDQITIENVAESNVKAIQTQNQMLGSLLDIIT